MRYTLSRISIRFSTSPGPSGGEGVPWEDRSARNAAEMMKGMSCDSTPSFARSSEAIGGKSGEWLPLSSWIPADMRICGSTGGHEDRK